ncbi:MAG: EboA domain-containing protein [Bacteroidota bacterium]
MFANSLLKDLLYARLDEASARPWLEQKLAKLADGGRPRDFYLSFSACSRFIPQEAIVLTAAETAKVTDRYPNFGATNWTLDELSRILLMTALPVDTSQKILDELFATADYRETVALYKGLYWLDNAGDFVARAREGLRTNMTGVFDALALDNPFPHAYLPEDAWNQMVLKAMFMQRPMYRIYRIEDRTNPELAEIFLDYAEERWSAHRTVSPELWRFTSGFPSERLRLALDKTIAEGTETERLAATKARSATFPDAEIPPENVPTWEEIGELAAED